MVAHLSFGEKKDNWSADIIANCVELGVQSALRATNATGSIPFLSRLAAVLCALRWELSIMIRSGGPL